MEDKQPGNDPLYWTFLPGLHGTSELYDGVKNHLPAGVVAEWVDLPQTGKQDYKTLTKWLDRHLDPTRRRLLIAESFSGPLALCLTEKQNQRIEAIVLAAAFFDSPVSPSLTLLPLRPLFMLKPPRAALRHFLIGEAASKSEVNHLRSVIQEIPSRILARRVRTVLEFDLTEDLGVEKTPLLLLQAQHDNLIPWESQNRLETQFPNAEIHWIDAPHLLFQSQSEAAVEYICKFLANSNID